MRISAVETRRYVYPLDPPFHAAWDPRYREGPYNAQAMVGIDSLLAALDRHRVPPNDNVWVDLGTVWRQVLTDPDQAVDFVRTTKVDALAIAMGTSHGAYKFSRKPDGEILAMKVVEEIHRRLPDIHLVMHGSSSVPQELQDLFNQAGGQMPQTWGVPLAEIERGIRHGVRKVNIDTDCRLAMTAEFRRVAKANPAEFDPRKFLKPAMDALRDLCRDRFERFGAAGRASSIIVRPLADMARSYRPRIAA